jgi:hypothetical protein
VACLAQSTEASDSLRKHKQVLPSHLWPLGYCAAGAHACVCSGAGFLMEEPLAFPLLDRWLVLHGSLQKRVVYLPWGMRLGVSRPGRAERHEQGGGGLRLSHHGPSPRRQPPDRTTHPNPSPTAAPSYGPVEASTQSRA